MSDDAAVGLPEAVAIEVGLIVGAGLFSLTGVAAGIAGTGLPVAYLVTFAVVGASLVPTAVLGAAYPTTAGNYRYPSRLWSPAVAFLAAWGLAISMFGGGLPVYALGFGQYLTPFVGVAPRTVGLVVLTGFFAVNLLGIRFAARIQLAMFATLVASLLVFVVLGLPAVESANFRPPLSTGVGGVLAGAAVLYFVSLGANFIVDLGEDVRAATLTIPRSFLVSVPFVFVLYLLTSVVAVGTVGEQAMAGAPLSVPAGAALSPTAAQVFVVGGATFAVATTINAVYMITPKYFAALVDDRLFPAVLAAENDRFGTPHWGLTVIWLVSVASLLSPLPLSKLGSLLAMGGITLIVAVMVAAVRFVRDRPGEFAALEFPLSGRVVVACAAFAAVMNVPLLAMLAAQTPAVFAGWVAVTLLGGGAILAWRVRRFAAAGVDVLDVDDDL